jgi:hypothetical protein
VRDITQAGAMRRNAHHPSLGNPRYFNHLTFGADSAQIPVHGMGLELTWIALAGSLLMALGGICLFAFAVKKDYFHDMEEAKFHVFWSDLEEMVDNERSKRPK